MFEAHVSFCFLQMNETRDLNALCRSEDSGSSRLLNIHFDRNVNEETVVVGVRARAGEDFVSQKQESSHGLSSILFDFLACLFRVAPYSLDFTVLFG